MSEEQKEPKKIKCPCCGQLTLTQPLEINTDLTDHYLSCIMSGVPFHHTYPLFDGKIEITISMLLSEDLLVIDRAVTKLEDAMKAEEEKDDFDRLGGMLRSYAFVKEIQFKSGQTKTYTPANDMIRCANLLITSEEPLKDTVKNLLQQFNKNEILSPLPYPLIESVCKTHITLYNILTDTGFDANFWKGIELA